MDIWIIVMECGVIIMIASWCCDSYNYVLLHAPVCHLYGV